MCSKLQSAFTRLGSDKFVLARVSIHLHIEASSTRVGVTSMMSRLVPELAHRRTTFDQEHSPFIALSRTASNVSASMPSPAGDGTGDWPPGSSTVLDSPAQVCLLALCAVLIVLCTSDSLDGKVPSDLELMPRPERDVQKTLMIPFLELYGKGFIPVERAHQSPGRAHNLHTLIEPVLGRAAGWSLD